MTGPSKRGLRLGGRIRSMRRREGLTQAKLAERLGISASYLNLIENNRRAVSAPLLLRLARELEIDVASLGGPEDARVAENLLEVLGDPIFQSDEILKSEVEELAIEQPALARAILRLYGAYREARGASESFAAKISDGQEMEHLGLDTSRLPSEEVSDFIQRHDNHFPELEREAEALWRDADLDREDLFSALRRHLARHHGVEVRVETVDRMGRAVRRFDPDRRLLVLSEVLRRGSRTIQLAHQIGLLTLRPILDRLGDDELLTTPESRALARVAAANYFAAAVAMPYEEFIDSAERTRWDVELLSHRFRAGFEQVCHRLTTLRRPGREGLPFHFVRIDIAGNISKRFEAGGLRFPRFSGLCPRWNVHAAFLTPGRISVQLARMTDGSTYLMIARTLPKHGAGFKVPAAAHAVGIGCDIAHAPKLVYSDGVDLDGLDVAVPVGMTCRLCDRMECPQRAFPSIQTKLRVDPDVRGLSFFAPVDRS